MQSLQKWKPKFKRGTHFSMLVIASRGSGKSYSVKYLLEYELRDKFDSFIVFCQSPDDLEEYKEILPGRLFFQDYNPDVINKIIEINTDRRAKGEPMIETLFLFDDQISYKMKYDDDLLQVFSRGRHAGVSIIFITQSHTYASTAWRNNSTYIILLRQNSRQTRDNVNKNILTGSIDVPEEANETKYYNRIMREYIDKPGDALVLDFEVGGFNNLFKWRAPERKSYNPPEKPKVKTLPPEVFGEVKAKVEEEVMAQAVPPQKKTSKGWFWDSSSDDDSY